MKARQLEKLGIPTALAKPAKWAASAARQDGQSLEEVKGKLKLLVDDPEALLEDTYFRELAAEMAKHRRIDAARRQFADQPPRAEPAPYRQWGDDLDANAIKQMDNACRLPVAAQAALMPDAHLGYGLPIGGVLAARNAVIPYAVGVDIACRVKLSVFDLPPAQLDSHRDRLINALEHETRFGMGASFIDRGGHGTPREHDVMDADWSVSPITQRFKDKAYGQLGTSGSGNHFVEFGVLTVDEEHAAQLGLPTSAGRKEYLALLSHSGSRGAGAQVCEHYSRLAMLMHPELDKQMQHLAWLEMDSHEGQEYWSAMNLMGEYASANHACIHDAISRHLGAEVLAGVENHHNFAWKETHIDPDTGASAEMIVHRKGATPAGEGVLGIIPGSMATPGYVVVGKGGAGSLDSASHGAGRVMSRKQAKNSFRWNHVKPTLEKAGVTLLSAGLDEVPGVYKDIEQVMADQDDLVAKLARFDPKLVKMAPAGERPED
ncbi:MAG: RtcB family protein [Phycisphaerales bacterium JB063]